jgi:hypothetical protein
MPAPACPFTSSPGMARPGLGQPGSSGPAVLPAGAGRYVLTASAASGGSGYASPLLAFSRGQVAALTAAQAAAAGPWNLRPVSSGTMHDQLGESAAVSNGD